MEVSMNEQLRESAGFHSRPRDFLEMAESMATCIRKDLSQIEGRRRGAGHPVSVTDALAIAELISDLARYGKRADAADAIMIAERVELLFDRLGTEIDFILTAHNHHAQS